MMTFDLRIYRQPSQAEVLLQLKRAMGWERLTAIVDTRWRQPAPSPPLRVRNHLSFGRICNDAIRYMDMPRQTGYLEIE